MTHVFRGTEYNQRVTRLERLDRFAKISTRRRAKDEATHADERGQHTLKGEDGSTESARTREQTAER